MRIVEYMKLLNPGNSVRIRFDTDHGQILRFTVQLECHFDEWTPVLRYDTAHGFPHYDIIHPHGDDQKVPIDIQDFNEALSFAVADITQNWAWYRERYERWQQ